MGTPEFAVPTLSALVENQYHVVAVVTQPDKPVGRHGSVLQASPIKQYAMSKGIPVLQPEKMKDPAFVETLRAYDANLQVVVAFRMLPEVVWDMPAYGTFNVHAALLPQYRGAAPINWAVINGETRTGVTTFFLDHDIDTGRIIEQMPFDIPDEANVEYVYDGLMQLGATICLSTLNKIIAANGHPATIAQEDFLGVGAPIIHHAPKIFQSTCQIDFNQPAKQVYNFIRGLSPYPGAWTTLRQADGKEVMLKIFRTTKTGQTVGDTHSAKLSADKHHLFISCTDEWLQVDELQMAGKKRMDVQAFLNGTKDISSLTIQQG